MSNTWREKISQSPVICAIIIAFSVRAIFICMYPENYAFDAFQRWAGREHLLVRDWLPMTQALIWICNFFGGTVLWCKLLLSFVAALGVGAATAITQKIGGNRAAWICAPIGLFSPFVVWSSTLYQEGTFLCLSLGAIALVMHLKPEKFWIADIIAGAVALTRYEGWPFVILYIIWRKDWKATIALWGAFLWLYIRHNDMTGVQPSPIDYKDWNGMGERFDWDVYFRAWGRLLKSAFLRWAVPIWIISLWGFRKAWGKNGVMLLLFFWLSQWAAILGWVAGLQTTIHRMLVVPTVLSAIFAAYFVSELKDHRLRKATPWVLMLGMVIWIDFSWWKIETMTYWLRKEAKLSEKIVDCKDCTWWVVPRVNMGTRNRHDGCEILQGQSNLKHGRDFWCSEWPSENPPKPTHIARWKSKEDGSGKYIISVVDKTETEFMKKIKNPDLLKNPKPLEMFKIPSE